jgi:hypothetical protein
VWSFFANKPTSGGRRQFDYFPVVWRINWLLIGLCTAYPAAANLQHIAKGEGISPAQLRRLRWKIGVQAIIVTGAVLALVFADEIQRWIYQIVISWLEPTGG